MARNRLVVDLDSCVGCHSCAVVCKQENNVGLGTFYNKVLTIGPTGTFPNLEMYYLPVGCQHCEKPQCVSVCPTGASYKREDGIVLVDHSRCIGCQYCVMACPYGVRTYDESKEKGVIEKCTLCAHLVDAGRKPACVFHCPGQARFYGDLDDPESEVAQLVAAKKNHQLVNVGNDPSVIYLLDRFQWKGGE